MSRYTGPKARVSRRLATNIWGTKGEADALEKRPYPQANMAGLDVEEMHLNTKCSFKKTKARFTYGLTERQFRNIFKEASRREGVTGDNMLRYLELRLDNFVYRSGWASTRPQARQFVNHGHVSVNGKRVDIPSYRLRKDDEVTLRDKAKGMIVIQWNNDVLDREAPAWIELADDRLGAKFVIYQYENK